MALPDLRTLSSISEITAVIYEIRHNSSPHNMTLLNPDIISYKDGQVRKKDVQSGYDTLVCQTFAEWIAIPLNGKKHRAGFFCTRTQTEVGIEKEVLEEGRMNHSWAAILCADLASKGKQLVIWDEDGNLPEVADADLSGRKPSGSNRDTTKERIVVRRHEDAIVAFVKEPQAGQSSTAAKDYRRVEKFGEIKPMEEKQMERPLEDPDHVHKLILLARWPHFTRLYSAGRVLHKENAYSRTVHCGKAFLYYLYRDNIEFIPSPSPSDSTSFHLAGSNLADVVGLLVMSKIYNMLCVNSLSKELAGL
ncbi:hypothetical protein VTL71DRAFT_9498 [Oculimacula yallundae]|uniref:Uncharacterized protein n=1 Tax=Oculimacula yallundae TaxID=86028 RepID=A0ABR4BSW8_9HELO